MRLLLVLLLWLAPARHAYHASITEVRYNGTDKVLEISIKVFADDFAKAISKGLPTQINLALPSPQVGMRTTDYLQHHLEFKTAVGAPLNMQFLGMQPEKDAYWLYCKVPLYRTMAGVKIRNTLLLDTFADQSNVVNLEAGTKKVSALFRSGHEEELLTW